MNGYKVFNTDWTCRGKQYTCPGEFTEDYTSEELNVCNCGMHFCKNITDCFNYYTFNPQNKVAEVVAIGDVKTEGDKSCTNHIKIIRELSWHEVLDIVNIGNYNTGIKNSGDNNSGNYNSGNNNSGSCNSGNNNSGDYNSGNNNKSNWNSGNYNSSSYNSGNYNRGSRNSGDWNGGHLNSGNWNSGSSNSGSGNSGNLNSGHRNSGAWNSGGNNSGNRNSGGFNSGDYNSGDFNSGNSNSGNRNSGNYNSGDWNTTNYSNGCFNTQECTINMFNIDSGMTYSEWIISKARYILENSPIQLVWVSKDNMTDEEKEQHPEYKTTKGYLKKRDAREKQEWWNDLSWNDQETVMALPNFDPDIFKECTGIDVTEAWNRSVKGWRV